MPKGVVFDSLYLYLDIMVVVKQTKLRSVDLYPGLPYLGQNRF